MEWHCIAPLHGTVTAWRSMARGPTGTEARGRVLGNSGSQRRGARKGGVDRTVETKYGHIIGRRARLLLIAPLLCCSS
eukprot:7456802-Pyramimonas_sp.AAC.1